jgi:hypothetical protein
MDQSNNTVLEKYVKIQEDLESGEKKEEEIHFKYKRTYRFEGEYMSMFQNFITKKVEKGSVQRLFGRTGEVLFYLLARMSFDNSVRIKQVDICRDLDFSKQHLNQILKSLEKEEFIKRGIGFIEINPMFVYKGKVKYHPNAK